jgi:hypothetical protein
MSIKLDSLYSKYKTGSDIETLISTVFLLKDIESGLRYAITQWEGDQNDIVAEFKRMRLSHNPADDERTLQIYLIIENIIDELCTQELKSNGKQFISRIQHAFCY